MLSWIGCVWWHCVWRGLNVDFGGSDVFWGCKTLMAHEEAYLLTVG